MVCGMQVSPHEFMQAVMTASAKKFTIEKQSDPVDFLSWFLNMLHADLTGGKRKKASIISRCFQVSTPAADPSIQRRRQMDILYCSSEGGQFGRVAS